MNIRIPPWFTCLSALVACADAPPIAGEPIVPPAANSGAGLGAGAGLAAPAAPVGLGYTEYLGQLTGRSPNAFSKTLGMTGTDLGIAFQRNDQLFFLFGDTWTESTWTDPDGNLDSIAKTSAALPPGKIPQLTWLTDDSESRKGRWLTFAPGGERLGEYNVPVEGVALDTGTYLFFHAGYDPEQNIGKKLIIANSKDDSFKKLEDVTVMENSTKFLSVSAFRDGNDIVIFGAGKYRQSPVYLARVAASELTNRSRWRYYYGANAIDPNDPYGSDESLAAPVMDQDCVGELSVRKHAKLGYLMSYNCKPYVVGFDPSNQPILSPHPDATLLRVASRPEGPWSESVTLFERAQGEEHFLHAYREPPAGAAHADDGLSEPGREAFIGMEYGPYLVPAWFDEPGPGLHGIVYTLSSWNPYQVHLMRTVLTDPGVSAAQPSDPRGVGVPRENATLKNPKFEAGLEGWTAEGFSVAPDAVHGGALTAATPALETVGRLSQRFTIDAATSTLRFTLHGKRARAVLIDTDSETKDILRSTIGRDPESGAPEPVAVTWRLETLRGKNVELAFVDDSSSYGAFIAVSGIELQ